MSDSEDEQSIISEEGGSISEQEINAEIGEADQPSIPFPGDREAFEDDDFDEDDDDEKKELQNALVDQDLLEGVDEEDFEEDDETTDDENESYDYIENKIDDEFKLNYIQKIHPEEITDSFHEIIHLTKIEKDPNHSHASFNLIQDNKHTTYPFLTKYEKSRILGLRISQLNEGAVPLVTLNHKIIDNHLIAHQELIEKKLPFIIMRPLPNGKKEYWRLQDLAVIER